MHNAKSTYQPSEEAKWIVDQIVEEFHKSVEERRDARPQRAPRQAKWVGIKSGAEAFKAVRMYEASGALAPYDLALCLTHLVKFKDTTPPEVLKRALLFVPTRLSENKRFKPSHKDHVTILNSLLTLNMPATAIAPYLALPTVRSFSNSDYTSLVVTYAKHSLKKEGIAALTVPFRPGLTAPQLALLAHSTVKLNSNYVPEEVDTELQRVGMSGCTFKDVASIIWAYGKVKCKPEHPVFTMAMERMALDSTPDAQLPVMLWGLANARVRAPGFYRHMGHMASEYMKTPLDFANVLWAYAAVGVVHEGVFSVPLGSLPNLATERQLCTIIWAYGEAGRRDGVEKMTAYLEKRYKKRPIEPTLVGFAAVAAIKVSYNHSFALKADPSIFDARTLSGLALDAYKHRHTKTIGRIASALATHPRLLDSFSQKDLRAVRKIFTAPNLAPRIARLIK
eukprot:TRINITY_DN30288_c0_g1_i1.p1 TRINITY_DN30288_c0_g1~~TRINITY_DN30288_c0_g1_i1.p1  ORF type:complete len:451 (+),score=108.52 TRINITY_DN30288_c0_g1_i1:68-1420(+)